MLCFLRKEPTQEVLKPQNYLIVTKKAQDIIRLLLESSKNSYKDEHTYINMYLSTYFMPKNQQLVEDTRRFTEKCNKKNYHLTQLQECFMSWVSSDRSPIGAAMTLWLCFLDYEIKIADDVHSFLTEELEKFSNMVIRFFQSLYPLYNEQKNLTKFKYRLLNFLSQEKTFKKIMNTFIKQFKKTKGVGGELTTSQVALTAKQIQELINFDQIQRPFQKSIKLIELFHLQQCLNKKIKYLMEVVHQIKEEIREYRDEFNLGRAEVGFDQLFPLVCFVCEQTYLNILASINYVNAFMGQNAKEKEKLLNVVSSQDFYCMQLIQTAASFYCHASKFI